MRGIVEVYFGGECIFKEENMIVDQGKEIVVDMLTLQVLDTHAGEAGYYAASSMNTPFIGFGQSLAMSISGGAHGASGLDNLASTGYLTSSLSGYSADPPRPTDKNLIVPHPHNTGISGFPICPNFINFSGAPELDPGYLHYGCFMPSGGYDTYASSLHDYNHAGVMDPSGFLYPNPRIITERVQGNALSSVYGVSVSADGQYEDSHSEVNYYIWMSLNDLDFFRDKYGGFQSIGLFFFDYYKTREIMKSPNFLRVHGTDILKRPLYTFSIDLLPKFKLFSKKVFQTGPLLGLHASKLTGTDGIGIVWRIIF